MSVVVETTLGDITIDLYIKERPRACLNFLKLCKIKYYNFNLFHTVNQGFIAQTGDPTGSRDGGESIWGVMHGPLKRYFEGEDIPRIKHTTVGLVSFVGDKNHMIGSQFFLTLAPDLTYLDAQHCVFGEVAEGFEVLRALNEAICDNDHRPYQDIRITHTVVLEDPYPDPEELNIPDASPEPTAERLQGGRIAPDEEIDETVGKSVQEVAEIVAAQEAKARATILEMIGDIPDAEMAPPENVLFVCKLNPITNDDDLEIIFSRFGKIKSCEVIRDKKTGDSLQYAFVEFEDQKSCEDAYFKMDNVLIDDRRIHVDFSQSVAKVRWLGKGRGVAHYNDKGERQKGDPKNDIGNGRYQENQDKNNKNFDRKYETSGPRERYKNEKRNISLDRSIDRHFKNEYDKPKRRDDYHNSSKYQKDNFGENSMRNRDEYREDSRKFRNDYRGDSKRNYRDDSKRRYDEYNYKNRTDHYRGESSRKNKNEDDKRDEVEKYKKHKIEKFNTSISYKKSKAEKKKSYTSSDESNSEKDERKKRKSKSKKSKKKKKNVSSESESESDSESSIDYNKSKKKKRKKKRNSSVDSEENVERRRKSRK